MQKKNTLLVSSNVKMFVYFAISRVLIGRFSHAKPNALARSSIYVQLKIQKIAHIHHTYTFALNILI